MTRKDFSKRFTNNNMKNAMEIFLFKFYNLNEFEHPVVELDSFLFFIFLHKANTIFRSRIRVI